MRLAPLLSATIEVSFAESWGDFSWAGWGEHLGGDSPTLGAAERTGSRVIPDSVADFGNGCLSSWSFVSGCCG